jgi:hypothetical protein
VVLLLPILACLSLQDTTTKTDTTPFRRGQWGVQFVGALGGTVGALKFRSPTSAWVVDLDLDGTHAESFVQDTLQTVSSQASLAVRLGQRTYRPVRRNVTGFLSLGLLLGFSHSVQTIPLLGKASTHSWQAGPFVDVGGTWLLTSHLGIGASWQAVLRYGRSSSRGPGSENRIWSLSGFTSVNVHGVVFF